ncbi:hypothetical protein COHA_009825 [Chlorella ohadii]|uniref:Uncharacterized protein n=1 Tax=Chlorella ohadii TaxID=2649997 RepID=A0AAD5H1V8_9CHLO|nr:hypothetical protein COHA_009825 [Chlorella ohadii]
MTVLQRLGKSLSLQRDGSKPRLLKQLTTADAAVDRAPLSKHDLEDLVLPPMGAAAAAPGGGHPRDGGDAGCMVRYLSRDSIKAEHVVELTQSVSIQLERVSSSRRVVEAAKRTLQKEAEEVHHLPRIPSADLLPTLERVVSCRRW